MVERNQNICTDDAAAIEGPSQETVDDPTKFSQQPSNGKCNHRNKQEFLYQLKMKITKYTPTGFSQPIMSLYSFYNEERGSTLLVDDLSNNRIY